MLGEPLYWPVPFRRKAVLPRADGHYGFGLYARFQSQPFGSPRPCQIHVGYQTQGDAAR